MDEYEIEDSLKFTPSCYSKEEEGTFINSQDFFMTQECDIKEESNFKSAEKVDKKLENEEKVKYIEVEEIKLKNIEDEINLESDDDNNYKFEDKDLNDKSKESDNFECNVENSESDDTSNKYKNDSESEESENDNSDEKSEDESESDTSSEEIVSVRRSKKNKNTPVKKTVKRTKIKPRNKKKESENKETRRSNKQKETSTKNNKDKNKESKDSSNTCSLEKDNKYNLNSNELKIFNFFYNINRPVSSTELALNFKGQIVSTALQGICTELESKSLLIIKVYSKSKIYMINPNVFDMNKAEEYKVELSSKIKINEELKKKYSDMNTELRSLKSMDTEEELDEKIKIIRSNIEEVEGRICLKEDGLLVTKKEVEGYEKKMKKISKVFKERSKIVQEILGMLCENMNIKKKELIEEMELDL